MMQRWADYLDGLKNGADVVPLRADWLDRSGPALPSKDKLFAAIRNGQSIRFTEACRIAELLGFERKGGKGSHCTYGRAGESLMLNFRRALRQGMFTGAQEVKA